MDDEFVVGTIPANTQELSNLMEQSPELEKEISYLFGGVESYRDLNQRTRFPIAISNEAASFDIQGIIKRILAYLSNLVKDVFDGSTAGSLAVESVINRAERVMLDGRSMRRNHQKTNFLISTRIQNLAVRYKPITDPQQLLIQLRILGSTIRAVMTYLTHSVFTGFEDLITFDPFTGDIESLAQHLQSSAPSVLAGDAKFVNQGFKIISPQLLGCQQVVIINQRPDGAALDQILGCNMSIQTAEKEPRDLPDSLKYDRFGLSLEQSLVKEVISVATGLSSYNTLNRRSIRRNRLKLINDRLATLDNQINSGSLDDNQVVNIRNYIRVLEVYSGWISSPYVGIIALTHRNLSAILNVCEGNAK